MRLKTVGIVAIAIAMPITLSGCLAAMQSIDTAVRTVNNVRAGTAAYHSYSMVKDLSTAEPLFQGYNDVAVMADVKPRDDVQGVPEAFADNMDYQVTSAAEALEAPVRTCPPAACSDQTLVVQFREDAYDSNIVQKISMGDRVRGRLIFSDKSSGRILHEDRIETAESYGQLMQVIFGNIMTTMLKSYPPQNSEGVVDKLNSIPPVKAEHENLFGVS